MTWDDAGSLGEHVARVVLANLTPELDRRERLAEERWKAALAAQTEDVERTMRESVASARREGAAAAVERDQRIARIESRIAPAGLLGALTSPKALVLMRALGTAALALLAALGYVHAN